MVESLEGGGGGENWSHTLQLSAVVVFAVGTAQQMETPPNPPQKKKKKNPTDFFE